MDDAGSPAASTGAESPANETKAQQQARLRRERRNAKIQAGGSERLSKITTLSGRPAAAEAELANTQPAKTPPQRKTSPKPPKNDTSHTAPDGAADDPAESDISNMFQRPADDPTSPAQQRELFRQLLQQAGPPDAQAPDAGGAPPSADDPLAQMLQQLLGGDGATAGGAGGAGGAPGGLAEVLAGLSGDGAAATTEPSATPAYLWRVVHGVCALCLAAFFALTEPSYTGTFLSREQFFAGDAGGGSGGALRQTRLFWMFATLELVLQTSRYFADRGRLPPGGVLSALGRVLPMPWAHYVRLLSRYSVIWTALISDVAVIVFVLGVVAWWKSLAAS